MTTILYLITFGLGVILGGFVVFKFNPDDLTINGKNKVKKGGKIDFTANTKQTNNKQRRKLFKRKNK